MNEIVTSTENNLPSNLLQSQGKNISEMILFDPKLYAAVEKMALTMANAKCTIPKHLQGNDGDCMAIIIQAMSWQLNPYSVAQKTHIVNGGLGYEAQLINSVLLARAPIEGRFDYAWSDNWNNEKSLPKDKTCTISFTLKETGEIKSHTISMAEVGVQNSPLWKHDPKQQLAYLCMKKLARLYFPDVIMGVYSVDELEDNNAHYGFENAVDVTPKKINAVEILNAAASVKEPIIEQPTKTEPTVEQKENAAEKAKINLLNNIEAISKIEHISMFLQSEANQSVLKRLQDGYLDKHAEVMTALQNKENQFKE
jgi:RecT family